jgi:hypothetical protein
MRRAGSRHIADLLPPRRDAVEEPARDGSGDPRVVMAEGESESVVVERDNAPASAAAAMASGRA